MTHDPRSPQASLLKSPQAWLVLAVTAVLTARFYLFINDYMVNTLFWDQFDFLQTLFDGSDLWARFRWQHGPHRQGLGNILLTLIYGFSDWDTRTEGFVSATLLVLTCCGALAFKYRVSGRLVWSDAIIPLIFLTLFQYEQFTATENPAHGPIPSLLIMAVGLTLLSPNPGLRAPLLALLNFCGVYTGFAFFTGILVPPLMALDLWRSRQEPRYRWVQLASLGLAVLGTASFFIGYKHQPAIACYKFPHDKPVEYIKFAAMMFARAGGALLLMDPPQAVSLKREVLTVVEYMLLWATALVAAYRVLRKPGQRSDLAILFFSGFTLAFGLFAAIGRVCAGLGGALPSRYVSYSLPGFFAVYLAGVLWLKPSWWRTGVLAVALGIFAYKETFLDAEARDFVAFHDIKTKWVACYLQKEDIAACDRGSGLPLYPEPEKTHLQAKLAYLKAHHLNFFKASVEPKQPALKTSAQFGGTP